MPLLFFAHQIYKTAEVYGIIDEHDSDVLESFFSNHGFRIKIEKYICLSIMTVAFLLALHFGGFFLLLPASLILLLILPRFVCFLLLRVDHKIHSFVRLLRRNEIAVFCVRRLENTKLRQEASVFKKDARYKCFHGTRRLVEFFVAGSLAFCSRRGTPSEDLLCNFINQDLDNLVTKPLDQLTAVEMQIPAINALWRYMFLVRSEFIRHLVLCIVTSPFLVFHPTDVFSAISIIFLFQFEQWDTRTSCFNKHSKMDNISKRQMTLSPREICSAQLECVLECINSSNRLPDDRMHLIYMLQNVISILGNCNDESNLKSQRTKESENIDNIILGDNELDTRELKTDQNEDEFKIFEYDMCTEVGKNENTPQCTTQNDVSELLQEFNRPVIVELKDVLALRKDYCLKKEIEALAKFRGVSTDEIDADELDRHLFSARFTDKEASEVKREPTSRGPFGIAPSAHDLGKIMELRKNFVWPEEDGSTIFSDVE